jgi:hypothetical protein
MAEHAVTLGRYDKAADLLERGYDHDLAHLARHLAAMLVADAEHWRAKAADRERLVTLLRERGIELPAD